MRQPQRLGAVVLLCVTGLAAAGVQSSAGLMLQATIDDEWRGDYDILVTATDELGAIEGLLPPNALGSGGEGLSLGDWDVVEAIDGVGVAAPLGSVLVPGLKFSTAGLLIPGDLIAEEEGPQAYRVTTTFTTDDGLGERIVQQESTPLVFDPVGEQGPTEEELQACTSSASSSFGASGSAMYTADPERHQALMRYSCSGARFGRGASAGMPSNGGWGGSRANPGESSIEVGFTAPNPVTRIDLVDPESERALLGDRGSFLDPLVSIAADADTSIQELSAWAEADGGTRATEIEDMMLRYADASLSGYPEDALADLRALFAENGDDFDASVAKGLSGSGVMPLIISDVDVAALTMRVDVEAFGPTTKREDFGYEIPQAITDGSPGERIGTAVGDVADILNPFSDSTVGVGWPGTDAAAPADSNLYFAQQIMTAASGSPMGYSVMKDGVELNADGFAEAINDDFFIDGIRLIEDGTVVGAESAFLTPRTLKDLTMSEFGSAAAVPIGAFDPDDIAVDDNVANYVPLGAYAPVGSEVSGGQHSGTTMEPSLTGLGLVASRTVAIGSIHSAAIWGDDRPISSIRVRVTGIDGYTAEARKRVIQVAQSIEDLGFNAAIVAGSSPTDADVLVNDYAFGTDDVATPQVVGSLGTVTQRWSELGAAARVNLSISTGTWAMLAVALAAGVLLLGATQVASIPGRRQQAVVMRELGFPRARRARWFAAEEIPSLVIVTVIAGAAWMLSGQTAVAAVAAGVAVAALVAASTLTILSSSQTRLARVRDSRSRRRGARSVTSFGLRQALIHPVTSIVHASAIVIVGLAAAALTQAIQESREAAGASSLSQLVATQMLIPQLILGAVGIVGGVLLARLVRRLDLARRSEQWATLRAAGWTSGQVARAQRAEGMAIVGPALILTGAAAAAGALLIGWTDPWLHVALALAAGALSALLSFMTRTRGTAL
ncbi:hypothetical protein [Microbacterium sp. A84]|uniref:hypothetical protein n=1 Tax=Microbacterium sp. A84 TaxID=3450715 RepID=UPI003F428FE8